MKKKIVLGLVLILGLAVLAGCKKENQAQQGSKQGQSQQEEQAEEAGSLKSTLKGLMGMGKEQKCTWSFEDENGKNEGVVYVDGEKFRQEAKFNQDGKEMTAYIISDGEWFYQWLSDSKEGTKMKISEMEQMAEDNQSPEKQASSEQIKGELNQEIDYDCDSWGVDSGMFFAPVDVTFSDMTEMIKNLQQNSQQMMQDVCKMCESLPAEAKTECLKNCQQ